VKKVPSTVPPVISVDRNARQPLHKQIYDGFRGLIVAGNFTAGQQVPSSRALAAELKISRIPVLTAYAQLLAEGYFEARTGSGTFVCGSLPHQFETAERRSSRRSTHSGAHSISRLASTLPPYEAIPWLRRLGAFNVGQAAFDQFPFRIWSGLVVRHCRNPQAAALQYGGPLGVEPLREAICAYLRTARSVHCDPGQVMIVTGSQQALDISARALLDPGDAVWLEEPGYWLTRHVLTAARCRLVALPVDSEGMDVAAGIKRSPRARAAFVAPSHQFPLGATMSASRRLQLLDWAEGAGAWIIEDDYDSEYRYDSMPIASLQGLDSNSRVIYIGTFSKTLFPSLRLGFIVMPADLVDRFSAVRRAMDISPPQFFQSVLTDFMSEGHYARHIRRTRQLYAERRSALVHSLRSEFGDALRVVGAEAGMYLTVLLANGLRDQDIAVLAAKERLWVPPLSPLYLGETRKQGFVLGFASTSAEEMPKAVRSLKAVVDADERAQSGHAELKRCGYC
jgi:GntR family transcriptional regulator / MocR family aminotransferase